MPFISAVTFTLPSDTPTSAPSPSVEIYATEVLSTDQVILGEAAKYTLSPAFTKMGMVSPTCMLLLGQTMVILAKLLPELFLLPVLPSLPAW